MRHNFRKLLLTALAFVKPKRKPSLKKIIREAIWMTVLFVILTAAMVFQYQRGRNDERAVWEPRWQMEKDVYRTMPFRNDD